VSRKYKKIMEKFAKPVTEHGVWRNRTTQQLTEKLETRDLVKGKDIPVTGRGGP
jgi:hypothetical protein